MLENARRQLILVLITIVAGLACYLMFPPQLGQDLKGGTQLIYEVPEEVLQKIVQENPQASIDAIMDQTVSVIAERVDPAGTIDAVVTRSGTTNVLIELPDMPNTELELVKARIASLGKLELRVVATDDFVMDGVDFDLQKEKERLQKWLADGGKEQVLENWKAIENFNENPQSGPLAYPHLKWYPRRITASSKNAKAWDHSYAKDMQPQDGVTPLGPATVAVYDDAQWNGGLIPEAMLGQEKEPYLLEFVAINMKEQSFAGEDLDPGAVHRTVDDQGRLAVGYQTTAEVAGPYGDWSAKYIKKHSAIILNGEIKSAPYFVSRIPGRGQISGSFTDTEVEELVKVLRTGSLQVEPSLLSSRTVGKTLGDRAVYLGTISLLAGALAVFVFMLWYYRLAGVVACVTLLLNVGLLWAALLFMQATITLPGLGGIVLTMGMAVDANVLIYERIREEVERGKDMLRAVRAGFERAMSAILDANITTFLTGLVLFNVGVGPVRGFAVTLMVGIVTTVFTQFFVTRLLFHFLIEKKKLEKFDVRRLFAQPTIDWLKFRNRTILASAAVIVFGLVYALGALPSEEWLGVDFKGGGNLQMRLQEPMTAAAVRERLQTSGYDKEFGSFSVNTIEADADDRSRAFNIRLKLTDAMRAQIEQQRTEEREARRKAEQEGQEPPPAYEPPYVTFLRREFADQLAKPAYSDAKVVEKPQAAAAGAEVLLHFEQPVLLDSVQQLLTEAKLPDVTVSVPPGAPEAMQSKDVWVQWSTAPTTRPWALFETLQLALKDLKAGDAPVVLSQPFPHSEEIQGRMVGELRNAAIGALILSWALIIFYLRVRFHEYKYGLAAVAALIHDVLVAFVVVVIANHFEIVNAEIGLNMIACFLTIIGYSVNDTIVIFDRIRENVRDQEKFGGKLSYREIINLSINQTMSRTVLTTGVTMFVVLAQFLVNWHTGSDLESFAFGMLVGMVAGTYSTIFIAGPVLVWVNDRFPGSTTPTAPPAQPVAVEN